jgi:hypothetical protein
MVRVTISPVGVPIRQTYSAIGIDPDLMAGWVQPARFSGAMRNQVK